MRDHDRLTLALVLDSFGNRGNGTSNSAIQYAQGLEALGDRPTIRHGCIAFLWSPVWRPGSR